MSNLEWLWRKNAIQESVKREGKVLKKIKIYRKKSERMREKENFGVDWKKKNQQKRKRKILIEKNKSSWQKKNWKNPKI